MKCFQFEGFNGFEVINRIEECPYMPHSLSSLMKNVILHLQHFPKSIPYSLTNLD